MYACLYGVIIHFSGYIIHEMLWLMHVGAPMDDLTFAEFVFFYWKCSGKVGALEHQCQLVFDVSKNIGLLNYQWLFDYIYWKNGVLDYRWTPDFERKHQWWLGFTFWDANVDCNLLLFFWLPTKDCTFRFFWLLMKYWTLDSFWLLMKIGLLQVKKVDFPKLKILMM